MNFSAVNHWDAVASLPKVCGCGLHTCKNTHICVVFTRVYRLIFTKFSANVERLLGFITTYSNCDGSIKGCCYGYRFEERVGETWHTLSSFYALSFNIQWEYRNVDCCFNIDYFSTSDKNFVNFSPVTSKIFWWLCRGVWVHVGKMRTALVFKGHSLGGTSIASL